jgi:hypothetical protein
MQFFIRQHFRVGQPFHALCRHAVGTTKIAAISNRDAQVAHGTPKWIDQFHGHILRLNFIWVITWLPEYVANDIDIDLCARV